MNIADLPRPRPIPLEWVTPSLANDLLDCSYRVAWQLDNTYRPLRRPSTYSELGVVAHGVIEDAAHGMFVGDSAEVRAAIERRWNERATRAEDDLAHVWEPAQTPSRDQWPGYYVTKARVIRHVADLSTRPERTSATFTPPSIESALADERAMLRGRPDRVEGPHGARRIVDVKSGLHQVAPSPPQLRQLMLYGHLVEATTDDRVEEIAIEDASGKRWVQSFDRAATDSLVSDIMKARDSYNTATHDGSLIAHATPVADGCRWCPFRVVCSPYWSSLETSWGHASALGTVRRAQPAAAGSVLELELASPSDAVSSTWVVTSAPIELATPDREIAIADGEFTGDERHLRWRWSTLTWPLLNERSGPET